MKTAKQLYQEIKAENNLPSEAGFYFRILLGIETELHNLDISLGYRELDIIKDWLSAYLDMPQTEKGKLIDSLIKEK